MTPAQDDTQDLKVHFINVGYGDSILVELPDGKTLLIDAGSQSGSQKVTDYLKERKVRSIDAAVITHPHENHFGGFFRLAEEFPIGQAFINGHASEEDGYPELLTLFAQKKIGVTSLKRGDAVPSGSNDVSLEVLHPRDGELSGDRNRHSLVIRLTYGKTSILFTGDIDEESQRELVEAFGPGLSADLIQVPHHGLPITNIFLERFKAPLYIISTGPSQWGLPLTEELDRLPGKVLRTDREGDIVLRTDGRRLKGGPQE